MIPAAIQAPQAVAETINSFCPPGLSVAPVGTTITLYRGASKTPFASFAYTGPDSVLGIVVATWRIALADHGQPVTNITNVSPDVEKMKALVDALEILGWSHALEPTAFARSYLVIEQQTLAEAREAAAQAESRVRALESESADRLDALSVLGYHPDMNLDEWTEARMKQRDATESRVRVLESEVAALRDSEQRAVEASVRQSKTSEDALRAAQHESDIGVITQAYFAAGFGPSPATPGGIASALDKARRRGDALRALGWDGLVDPETWARHCPTENETLAQIRGAILESLGLAKQGTGRPIIELLGELVDARDKARHYADRARMNLDDAKKWEVRVLDGFRALAFSVDPALSWPHPATLPTSMEIKALCDRAESARKGCPADKAPIGKDAYIGEVTARYESPDASPVDKDLGKPATIGVRFTMEPGEGVDVARVLSTQIPTPSALFAADGDSRFKIADARRWKRGASATQDRVGRVWATRISGSCVGMTGLPFKAGRTVRFVDAADKVVLAGEVLRYEAKHLGDRLEWEAEVLHEVLHEVNVAGHDATAGATAEKAGPRWTGITWMSKKGRAKTCRIEGLTFSAGPLTTVIKVPTSPYDLPTKLVRHIHGKKTLAFHVGSGKVITGIVDMVDASAISSMLLFVAT